jgi:hypothetical protein
VRASLPTTDNRQPTTDNQAPAAFAGDDLVAIGADPAHHHRLHHAVHADRRGEFRQPFRIHAGARLVLARLQRFHRQRGGALVGDRLGRRGVAQQGVEAAAESSFLG